MDDDDASSLEDVPQRTDGPGDRRDSKVEKSVLVSAGMLNENNSTAGRSRPQYSKQNNKDKVGGTVGGKGTVRRYKASSDNASVRSTQSLGVGGTQQQRRGASLIHKKNASSAMAAAKNKPGPGVRRSLSERNLIISGDNDAGPRKISNNSKCDDDADAYKPVAKVEWGLNHYYHGDSRTWRVADSGKAPSSKQGTVNEGRGSDWTNLPDIGSTDGNDDGSSSFSSSSSDDEDDDDDDNGINKNGKSSNNNNHNTINNNSIEPEPVRRKTKTSRRPVKEEQDEPASNSKQDELPSKTNTAVPTYSSVGSREEEEPPKPKQSAQPRSSRHRRKIRPQQKQEEHKEEPASQKTEKELTPQKTEKGPAPQKSEKETAPHKSEKEENQETEPAEQESNESKAEIMKEELKQQLKEEMKKQMMEELESEALKEQIRRELREEIRAEIREEVKQKQKQDKAVDDRLDKRNGVPKSPRNRQRTVSMSSDSDESSVYEEVVRKSSPIPRRSASPDARKSTTSAQLQSSASRIAASDLESGEDSSTRGRVSSRSSEKSSGRGKRSGQTGASERRGLPARAPSRRNLSRRFSGSSTRVLNISDDEGAYCNSSEMNDSVSRLRRRASISNTPSDREADFHPLKERSKDENAASDDKVDDEGMLAVWGKKREQDKGTSRTRRRNSLNGASQQKQQEQQHPAPPPNPPLEPGSPFRRLGKGRVFPFRGNRNDNANESPPSPSDFPGVLPKSEDGSGSEDAIAPNSPGHDLFAYFLPKGEHIIWIEVELPEDDDDDDKSKWKDRKEAATGSGNTVKGEDVIQYPELNIHLAAREATKSRSQQINEPYRPVGPLRDSTMDTPVQAF